VQFCRFAKLVEQLGARVVLSIQRDLRAVLRSLSPSIEIVDEDSERTDVDFQSPLASVPHALNLLLSDIPADVPYLFGNPDRVRHWRERLGETGYKVGICWQGSRNKIDLGRSIPLQHFATLAQVPGVHLISLQKGYGTEQLATLPPHVHVEVPVDGMGPDALEDLAALMTNLNLVITSDTLVAHLAGALGIPTWIALKQAPDWRWMLEREDSPWYPTAHLYRQKRGGDWDGVFAEIRRALSARMPLEILRLARLATE
jgi:ADP-heptose:LPS heptosyltransferase